MQETLSEPSSDDGGSLRWRQRNPHGKSDEEFTHLIRGLEQTTRLSPITLRVCVLRGLDTPEKIEGFLTPRFENLCSPFAIRGMEDAVQRLVQARERNERVRIFGDYDVDGTTGAALLTWVFRDFGFQSDARQPDRFRDGYGLNSRAVEEAAADGVGVLLTVDCGITSFDAAERARTLGLDLIVVDHHQIDPVRGLPPALAIVNPQRADCESGLRQVCGCGLAFYLAVVLRAKGRTLGWFAPGAEPNLKQHLDLVVIATAADMVPLTGDNHILVRYGMEVLKNSRKPGVRALMEVAGLSSRDISPSHLGFVLGPRINASGRMQSASVAFELLTSKDPARALELALELERLNQERALLQNQIWDEIKLKIQAGLANGKYRHGIAVADPKWHEGVVGIVASRVTEFFRKPAAVIALREDIGKGSVRSYGGKDVLSALRDCSSRLLGFGGHRHAAGLSIDLHQIDEFAEEFDGAIGRLSAEPTTGSLWIEGSCSIDDLGLKALEEIERLGPFGPGNPEPVFSLRASIRDQRILKGRHLKLNLSDDMRQIEAIWFHGAERKDLMLTPQFSRKGEWAGVPELNRFRGRVTPTFRVRDWRKVEGTEA